MPKWYGGSALNPDELLPQDHQWKIQWSRLVRWHDRVRHIRGKSIQEDLTASDMDIVIAFFQNCYHLRDWLEASQLELREDIKKVFHDSFEMGACRDMCHGFKHKALSNPSHDADFNLYREYDYFETKNNPTKYRVAFAHEYDIKKFDLFELVEAWFLLWKDFLGRKGLLPNQS